MKEKRKKIIKKEEKALLTFLKRTREGKYAKIEKSSSSYARIKVRREEPYDEYYYYSVR